MRFVVGPSEERRYREECFVEEIANTSLTLPDRRSIYCRLRLHLPMTLGDIVRKVVPKGNNCEVCEAVHSLLLRTYRD